MIRFNHRFVAIFVSLAIPLPAHARLDIHAGRRPVSAPSLFQEQAIVQALKVGFQGSRSFSLPTSVEIARYLGGLLPAEATLGGPVHHAIEMFDPRTTPELPSFSGSGKVQISIGKNFPKEGNKNAHEWFLQAQSFAEAKDFPAAIRAYRQALRLQPELFTPTSGGKRVTLATYIEQGLLLAGQYSHATRDLSSAVAAYEAILDYETSTSSLERIQALYCAARLDLIRGDIPSAMARFLDLEKLIQGKTFIPIEIRYETWRHTGMVNSLLSPSDQSGSIQRYQDALQFLIQLHGKRLPKNQLSQNLFTDFLTNYSSWKDRLLEWMTAMYFHLGMTYFTTHQIPAALESLETAIHSEFLDATERESVRWFYSFSLYRARRFEEAIVESEQLTSRPNAAAISNMSRARRHLARAWNPTNGQMTSKELSEGFRLTVDGLASGLANLGVTIKSDVTVNRFHQAVSALRLLEQDKGLEGMETGNRVLYVELMATSSVLAALLGQHTLAATAADLALELNMERSLIPKIDLIRAGIAALREPSILAMDHFHVVLGMVDEQISAEERELIDFVEHLWIQTREALAPLRRSALQQSA